MSGDKPLLNWRSASTSKTAIACLTSEEADSPKCRVAERRRPKFEPHSARYNLELKNYDMRSLITPVFRPASYVTQASVPTQRLPVTESSLNGEYYGVAQKPPIDTAAELYIVSSTSARPLLTHFLHPIKPSSNRPDSFKPTNIFETSDVTSYENSYEFEDDGETQLNVPSKWFKSSTLPTRKIVTLNVSPSIHSTFLPPTAYQMSTSASRRWRYDSSKEVPKSMKHATNYPYVLRATNLPYTHYPPLKTRPSSTLSRTTASPTLPTSLYLGSNYVARPRQSPILSVKSGLEVSESPGFWDQNNHSRLHNKDVVLSSTSVTPLNAQTRPHQVTFLSKAPPLNGRPPIHIPLVAHGPRKHVDYSYGVTPNPVIYDPAYFEDLWFDLVTPEVFYKTDLTVTTLGLEPRLPFLKFGSTRAVTSTPSSFFTTKERFLQLTGAVRNDHNTKASVSVRKSSVAKTTKSLGVTTARKRIYSTTLVHNVRPTTPMSQPSLTAVKGPDGNGDFPRTALISIASLSVIIIIAIVVFCVFRCRQSGPSPEQYPMVCNGKQARYTPIPTEMSPQVVHGEAGSHYVAQPISSSFIQTRFNQLNGYQPIKGTELPKLNGLDANKNGNSNGKKKDFKEWYV